MFWIVQPDIAGDIAGSSVVAVIWAEPLFVPVLKVLVAFPDSPVMTVAGLRVPYIGSTARFTGTPGTPWFVLSSTETVTVD
jgi:hypothetical protein